MPEEITTPLGQPARRPLFLTILCLITLIGSIGGIILNIKGYLKADEEVENITSGKSKLQLQNIFSPGSAPSDELVRIGNLNPENYKKFSIGCIAASILCLVGAILMLKLKRTGFYSFALGTFFNLITHFLLFGDNFGAMGFSIIAALAGLVFVILYGMNLKYMDEA